MHALLRLKYYYNLNNCKTKPRLKLNNFYKQKKYLFKNKPHAAPLCVIFFCYVAITRIFRTVTSQTSASVTSRAQRKDRARNVALMWTTVKAVITFVCGWTPYCAMVVLVVLGRVCLLLLLFFFIIFYIVTLVIFLKL